MSDAPAAHPADSLLRAFQQGRLEPTPKSEIEAHLQTCDACRLKTSRLQVTNEDFSTKEIGPPANLFAPSTTRLPRGTTLGRYVLLEELGAGGMGVVYSAFDPELNRRVAIKLLNATALGDRKDASEKQALLLREAQAMARVSHPNVVTLYDVGTYGDQVFIAMELVQGQTARAWVKSARPTPSWREVLAVFVAAGEGLSAAHEAGLVHRDFKPDNLLVADDGRTRVMDFGLARAAIGPEMPSVPAGVPVQSADPLSTPALSAPHLTQPGTVVGTLFYLAPEQLRGEPADARSDQFAFAVSLYECLYGQRPFSKKPTMGTADAEQWLVREPPRGTRVPASLRRVLLRALNPSPEARFADLRTLLTELRRDPARRLRQVAIGATVALVLGGVLVLQPRAGRQCVGVSAGADLLWDVAAQAQARAAFVGTGKPFAPRAFSAVDGALTAYLQSWRQMRSEACAARHERGEQSDEVLALRTACLDERLEAVRVLSGLFKEADASIVQQSVYAAQGLPPLEPCADVAALLSRIKLPAESQRARVATLRQELGGVKARFSAGRFQEALDLVSPLLERTRELGYRPLTAEAMSLKGFIESELGLPSAISTLEQAVWLADVERHEVVTAASLTRLLELYTDHVKPEDGLKWSLWASAAAEKLPEQSPERADHLDALGFLYERLLRNDDAIATVEKALVARRANKEGEPLALARTLNRLGGVLRGGNAAQQVRGRTLLQEALAIRESELGGDHPEVAFTNGNLGLIEGVLGDFEAASRYGRKTFEIIEKVYGTEHFFWSRAATNLAEMNVLLGSPEQLREAESLMTRVLAAWKDDWYPGDRIGTLSTRAAARLQSGDVAGAKLDAERALADVAPGNEMARELYRPLLWLGEVHLAQRSFEQARVTFERALALPDAEVISGLEQALVRAGLARALRGLGRDADRAETLRQEAVAALERAPHFQRKRLASSLANDVTAKDTL